MEVRFTIVSNADYEYQNNLDIQFAKQDSIGADDKIDIFLVEADDIFKYVESDWSLPLSDIGIDEKIFENQYEYSKEVATDSKGNLKGASWQCCPGAMIYRADFAEEVLGTSEPEKVQKYVNDWESFMDTAEKMKASGHMMTATAFDTYAVFSCNVTSKWWHNGVINVDANIAAWADIYKEMVDKGETTTDEMWKEIWYSGFYESGNIFCYFGPTWLYDTCMCDGEEGAIATNGGWRVTEGPQGFYWGGTWICAATGTDNQKLVADIIKTMTTDDEILTQIIEEKKDFVNDAAIIDRYYTNNDWNDRIVGGQNVIEIFSDSASKFNMNNTTSLDLDFQNEFQTAMKGYFDGDLSYEDALSDFYYAMTHKYSELSAPQ